MRNEIGIGVINSQSDPMVGFLLPDDKQHNSTKNNKSWKLLVVDDESDVHAITRMALKGFQFRDRKLDIYDAYSTNDAQKLLREEPDIAVVLLDVVMETASAGLDLTRWIRETLGNRDVRIVLRTGQPGQAPERAVITDYDINDYREKTELTAKRLYTMVVACLRSYCDLRALRRNRQGLNRIIEAMGSLFQLRSANELAVGVLEQLTALFYLDEHAALVRAEGIAAREKDGQLSIIAATGRYCDVVSKDIESVVPAALRRHLAEPMDGERMIVDGDAGLAQLMTRDGQRNALLLTGLDSPIEVDESLVRLFLRNIGVAFDSQKLMSDIDETERELMFRLGEAVETRSGETGNHVRRVSETARLLAERLGYSARDVELVYRAAPLHDVGKVAIPDTVLNKPGKLTAEEWALMQTHAEIGERLLGGSSLTMIRNAAIIAGQHHERWNGAGYPRKLSGTEIHPFARLVGALDVFDALMSERCYKPAWPLDDTLRYFEAEAGRQFDPDIARCILDNVADLVSLRIRIDEAERTG